MLVQGCERKAAIKKFIVKMLVARWCSEFSDCILSPQAYLHYLH
jgi:hypothetical protein